MTGSRRASRMIMALLGTVLVIAMAAPVEAAMTVKGDTAAWKEIDAALTKLHALPGWRVRESQSGGSAAREMEFAPPNYHITRRTPAGTFEVFQVGGVTVSRSYTKNRPEAKCRRLPRTRQLLPPQDLKDYMASGATGELTIGRKPDASINSLPVHAYTYLFKQAGATVRGDVFIGTQTGLPLRSTSETPNGRVVTRDYYDYGAKLAFALPC